MFGTFFRLFDRYRARHLVVRGRVVALAGPDGERQGYLDRLDWHGNRIELTGWTLAPLLRIRLQQTRREIRPEMLRVDVTARLGLEGPVGFFCSLPAPDPRQPGADFLRIELVHPDHTDPVTLRLPGRVARARAELRLFLRYCGQMLGLVPDLVRIALRNPPDARARVRDTLGLGVHTETVALDSALIAPFTDPGTTPGAAGVDGPITILLPVYNAFDLLPEVLDRVARHTDLPWRLVVIEDASPDPRVRPWLRTRLAEMRAETGAEILLIENAENLGFIRSVNKGLAEARRAGGPVVLLNSDAFVPAGWASRLVAPLLDDPSVATVTPMSNDAEIFSVPAICVRTVLAPGQGDAIDAVARRFSAAVPLAEAPTGVGFCMAMNPEFLEKLPELDTAFGRGYGEEVDWCRKAAALGGRHVGLPGLFVEHRGGESFGSEEKLRLVQANNALIERRYPGYDRMVQAFIGMDPLLTPRLALALAWAGSQPGGAEVPVYLAHSMGGGAELWLETRMAADPVAVVLRVGGPWRCRIELVSAAGRIEGATSDLDLVRWLLRLLPRRRMVYSCAVGDPDPAEIAGLLHELSEGPEHRLEMMFHDYLPVSPSYTLLDSGGVYRGPVVAPDPDPAHATRRPDGSRQPLEEWQAQWGRALAAADEITVFSSDSRDVVTRVWPALSGRVSLRPHALLHPVPPLPSPPSGRRVLAVLGNIGAQKGAAIVAALSRRLAPGGDPGLVVIGNVDPAFPMGPGVTVHGDYRHADIPALAERYGVTHWLVPSIWPETFSYTVHEALATGLPVLAFDLGAQGEAVRAAANGHPVALPPGGDAGTGAAAVLAALEAPPVSGRGSRGGGDAAGSAPSP